MVAANDIRFRTLHERRNAYVIPCLGVFRYQHVADLKSKSFDLVASCGCLHEGHSSLDAFMVIDVRIVAEANAVFMFLRELVDVTDTHSAIVRSRRISQWAGTSPSHSTPESFNLG